MTGSLTEAVHGIQRHTTAYNTFAEFMSFRGVPKGPIRIGFYIRDGLARAELAPPLSLIQTASSETPI
ncbi:hypothetical protein VOM14_12745 [Paraburkholderia sp. MPAMCS5]|uniref:hypothetical protein n=1 Tax=Paraburkholderia sp. MPAMCS5 TaxID=3112563 RepID=UPI002E199490|nr:hypothetical protein [Paraburkholderia sp. MPAMCS5]